MKNRLGNLLNRYKALPPTARAGLWFAVCGFAQRGVSLVTIPLFARLLTTEQYGVVTVFNSWETLLAVLCTLNLYSGGFNNGMLLYETRRDEYLSAIQGLVTVIVVGWVSAYSLGHRFFDRVLGMPPVLTLAMFLQIFSVAALSLWTARERYEFRYAKVVAVTVLNAVLSGLVPAVLICFYPPERGAQVKILAQVSVMALICGCVYLHNLRQGKHFYNRTMWKQAFLFNLPLLPHYLSTMILNQADRIMIDRMVGTREAGIYGIAYSASMVVNILSTAVNNAFAPWLYRRISEGQPQKVAGIANGMFLGLALLQLCLIAFAPECILLLAGERYMEAVYIIPPVASSLYFIFMFQIFANVEFYYRKNRFIALASVTGAVLNIILNYFGIQRFGYIAAGYTTLLCYILFGLGHCYFMLRISRKELPKTKLFDIRFIFTVAAGLIFAALTVTALYDRPVIRYLLLAVICCVAVANRGRIRRLIATIKEK